MAAEKHFKSEYLRLKPIYYTHKEAILSQSIRQLQSY